jgi:opacity protein-like surface antigen
MRKLIFAALVLFSVSSQTVNAQYYYYNDKYYDNAVVIEVGASVGVMNSLTDVGGKKGVGKKFIKDLNWKNAKPTGGFYVAAMFQDKIGLRLEGTFGQVGAYDSILKDVKATTFGRYERNLSFKSKISEFQLGLEIHPLMFRDFDKYDPPRLSPYAYVGIGYFSFDPQAKLNGKWYSLQPLHTEGQGFDEFPDRKNYKLSQFNFAGGLGLKYEVSSMVNAKLEFNHRFLTTDYLDDVSTNYIDPNLFYNYLPVNQAAIAQQLHDRKGELDPNDILIVGGIRGNPKNNDSYFTIQLKIGMAIGRQKR